MQKDSELFRTCFYCECWEPNDSKKRNEIFQYEIEIPYAPPNMKGNCSPNPEGAEVLTKGVHARFGSAKKETSSQWPCDVSYMVFDKKSDTTIRLSAFKLHPDLKAKQQP